MIFKNINSLHLFLFELLRLPMYPKSTKGSFLIPKNNEKNISSQISIDKYKHTFYTYHQGNTIDLSSNGAPTPSDRSMYIIRAERSLILSHIFKVISSSSARFPVVNYIHTKRFVSLIWMKQVMFL